MCPPTTFEQRAEIYAHMLARLRAKDTVGMLDVKELAKRIQAPVHRVSRVIRRFQEHVPRNKWLSTLEASPQVSHRFPFSTAPRRSRASDSRNSFPQLISYDASDARLGFAP